MRERCLCVQVCLCVWVCVFVCVCVCVCLSDLAIPGSSSTHIKGVNEGVCLCVSESVCV